MLEFWHDADDAPVRGSFGRDKVDDFLERHHLEHAVVLGAAGTELRNALDRAQGFEFRQREVVNEPAVVRFAVDGLARLAAGELLVAGHVGGLAQVGFVARDQHAIFGCAQVRLHVIGAIDDGLGVRGQRVFGTQRAGAAVAEYQWTFATGDAASAQRRNARHAGLVNTCSRRCRQHRSRQQQRSASDRSNCGGCLNKTAP